MKRLSWVLLLVTLLLFGCSTKNETKQEWVIGVDDTFAPMGFRDDQNELAGFDIDLAKETAQRLGMSVRFQTIDWSMKETELNAGNIDMIWNGYSITEQRKSAVSFSNPYLDNRQLIVVLAASSLSSKADLAGKTVSVQKESSALEAVLKETAFTSALKEKRPLEFDTNLDCFMDLEAGRTDAIVVDEVLARYVIKQRGSEKYRILEEDFGREQYAVGMRKSDTELTSKINKVFDEMQADGKMDEIKEKWFD